MSASGSNSSRTGLPSRASSTPFQCWPTGRTCRAQTLLFTEDATVESLSDGQSMTLKGRKQIGDTFGAYLATFETIYHVNGQQTVEIAGDKAKGTSYCLVVLIGKEKGKTIKNTSGVIYNDEYVRRGKSWLISKRVSNFAWRDREEMAPPPAR